MLIKVYLANGSHIDLTVDKGKAAAEVLLIEGVWSEERGEHILYPPSQILKIRLVHPPKALPKVKS